MVADPCVEESQNKSDCRRFAPASLCGGLQPVQKPVASPLIFLFSIYSLKQAWLILKIKKPRFIVVFGLVGGERGIRTPGPVTVNSFQDYRNRPLCHLSAANVG